MMTYLIRWNNTGRTALIEAEDQDDLAGFFVRGPLYYGNCAAENVIFTEFTGPRLMIEFDQPGHALPSDVNTNFDDVWHNGTTLRRANEVACNPAGLPVSRHEIEEHECPHLSPEDTDLDREITSRAFPRYYAAFHEVEGAMQGTDRKRTKLFTADMRKHLLDLIQQDLAEKVPQGWASLRMLKLP